MRGWIGVDLDGTLAQYDGWKGSRHIGKPIKPMVDRVKQWLKENREVRIFTARVCSSNPERESSASAIQEWCRDVFGQELPVTSEKDFRMIELWDDRCIQVMKNVGDPVIPFNFED